MSTKLKFGLLLPHFGAESSFESIIQGAQKAESYGFDSVWVRDHLIFEPHGMEGQDNTHYDCFVTLAAVGATTKLTLGTGTIIPHRHPVYAAQLFASLNELSGGGVIAGIGQGTFRHEFDVVGYPSTNEDRFGLIKETATVMQRLWNEGTIEHHGQFFQFDNVEIRPKPASSIPIWYGGSSPASCRRAADYCDG